MNEIQHHNMQDQPIAAEVLAADAAATDRAHTFAAELRALADFVDRNAESVYVSPSRAVSMYMLDTPDAQAAAYIFGVAADLAGEHSSARGIHSATFQFGALQFRIVHTDAGAIAASTAMSNAGRAAYDAAMRAAYPDETTER